MQSYSFRNETIKQKFKNEGSIQYYNKLTELVVSQLFIPHSYLYGISFDAHEYN